jgi:hypothetical protein
MVEIILEHPYLSFFTVCVIVDGITSIVKSILNYRLDKKSKNDYGLTINGGNNE